MTTMIIRAYKKNNDFYIKNTAKIILACKGQSMGKIIVLYKKLCNFFYVIRIFFC